MSFETLLFRIRQGNGKISKTFKRGLTSFLHLDLPAPKLIFRPIYELLVLWRFVGRLFFEKLIYVPVFKSRCSRCGPGLRLPNGIPWLEGDLEVKLGSNVIIEKSSFLAGSIFEKTTLEIGDRTFIGDRTSISVGKSVEIGKDCLIAGECFICDNDGHPVEPNKRLRKQPVQRESVKPVVIHDNVWICKNVVILKGVTIGKGSIVAANSLVNGNVPPNCIVMGVPSKIIRSEIDSKDRVVNKGSI